MTTKMSWKNTTTPFALAKSEVSEQAYGPKCAMEHSWEAGDSSTYLFIWYVIRLVSTNKQFIFSRTRRICSCELKYNLAYSSTHCLLSSIKSRGLIWLQKNRKKIYLSCVSQSVTLMLFWREVSFRQCTFTMHVSKDIHFSARLNWKKIIRI